MNLKCISSVNVVRQLPPLWRRKVAEMGEMIMEGERRGRLMGGNHLDVALILMSHFCSKSSWRGQTHTLQRNRLHSETAIVLSARRPAESEASRR